MKKHKKKVNNNIEIRRVLKLDIVFFYFLQYGFQLAFQKFERSHNSGKTSSYNLRALLWEAGCTVSNKVLECLVLRFSKNRIVTTESYIMALIRLYLAHGESISFFSHRIKSFIFVFRKIPQLGH